MLPSIDGRSSEQVWADFFQRFPENCNTNSETAQHRTNTVILPDGTDIKKVLHDLGNSRGERYLLFLNHLFFRGIFRRKTAKEEGSFLPVHRNSLVQIGGNRYKQLLDYGTKTVGQVIKSPKTYVVGGRCNEYGLNKNKLNFSRTVSHTLITKAAIRIWRTRASRRRKEFVRYSPARAKIADSVDGLVFDYNAAFNHVDRLQDTSKREHRINVLLTLMSSHQLWSVDKQGRNYTVLVVVPRDIRRFFSHRGQPLVTVDIKSCHPLLHSLLYPENEPEKVKYIQTVQGDFWQFMNEAAGCPYNLKDPDEKELLKEKMWSQVFYGWKEEKPKANALFARAFENQFPVLWQLLQDAKTGGRGKLPRGMMATEADVVMAAVEKLESSRSPVISVHDAIVTTAGNVDAVRRAILDVFAELKLVPVLTVSPLTA